MENNATLIGVGVGTLVVAISFLIYQRMGCATSAPVNNNKVKPSENEKGKKSDGKKEVVNKYPAGKMSIYFGSQTGTAEGFARTLMEEGKNTGFDAKTVDLEDFDPALLKDAHIAVFLMATYGEGEPTDNAAVFTKWLKNEDNSVSPEFLANLRFSVFGLGNRQYEHYNRMGKITNSLLETLGARRIAELGEGDDDGTLEEDFDAWKAKLWPVMYTEFHPAAKTDLDRSSFRTMSGDNIEVTSQKVSLTFQTVDVVDLSTIQAKEDSIRARSYSFNGSVKSGKINSSTRHFFTAPHATVAVNRELRVGGNSDGSTKHIEVDLKNTNVQYLTADNLAILPENSRPVVEALAASLGYDLDHHFNLEPTAENEAEFKLPFPTPCSVRELLTSYLDIQGMVKYTAMKHLVSYVTDIKQKEWLVKLLHKDNRPAFKAFVEDDGKSLADVLTNELSSARIPLSDLIHIATYIQPRYYTISSSNSVHPETVHITVSITKYAMKSGRVFNGLASQYLDGLVAGSSSCRIYIRPSSFRLPATIATPIIMIGPGTGLAPMRALLQEREFQANGAKKSTKRGSNVLFFGCKNKNVDFIYRDELEAFQEKNVLNSLHLAFSRDSAQKVYVQHLLADPEIAASMLDLLFDDKAYVYVCGATLMGTDVHNTFLKILQQAHGARPAMSSAAASAYIKDLQERGRYVQELWTA